MPSITEFCQIHATLTFTPIGKTATGRRLDVPFDGVATSNHWEGERDVSGVDYITIGDDGVQHLDIRARIGSGRDVVSYRGIGRGTVDTGPQELLVFETANEDLSFLNSAVGVAFGDIDGNRLHVTVSLVQR